MTGGTPHFPEPGRTSQATAAGKVYSVSFALPRRGELSQFMMASQAVDGLRQSFDNADCVE
jgi:hypothetical protein